MDYGTRPAAEFFWGVATSAYQTEGGYNGAGEPQTNWASAEASGAVARVGRAAAFWTRDREDFALCRELGLNAFRLSIEWSRVQPTRENRTGPPPPFDYAALDHYAEMLAACRAAGLEPIVTLHHFVHPAWLGADAWLRAETVPLFEHYVAETVRYVNARLADVHGVAPVRYYITVNEPNMLVFNTYLGHQFPSALAPGFSRVATAFSQLFRAHLAAYLRVHEIYRAHAWPAPQVTLNNHCSDVYWSDKLWLDLLQLPARGVARGTVDAHLQAQAREFDAAVRTANIPLRHDLPYRIASLVRHLANWLGRRIFTSDSLGQILDAVYAAPRVTMDYLALDYYDPFIAHVFRLPVWWDHDGRNRSLRAWLMNSITHKWWDWRVLPRGLRFFCELYHREFQLPLLIAENGMALRRPHGAREQPRRDRMTRSEFLRLHLHEVERLRAQGLPLLGYLHWSLVDNYEWGTYTPRFGLFSVECNRDSTRVAQDPSGDRPAETYAQWIADARRAEESAPTPEILAARG